MIAQTPKKRKSNAHAIVHLKLSEIRLDGSTQSRAELEEWLIDEYKELYQTGVDMPPLDVVFDGDNYWLVDGFHRRWGADRAGLESVPCRVTDGTREDAQWRSYAANRTHGLRRSNEDKALAVKRALKHPAGVKLSDSQIAAHVGVSDKTVTKYRSDLESTSEIPKLETTLGRDGKQRRRRQSARSHTELPFDPGPVTCSCGVNKCQPGFNMCSDCLSRRLGPEPVLCPVCECRDCDTGKDRCQKCIDEGRTGDDDGELLGVMDDDGRFQFQDDLVAEVEAPQPQSRGRGIELAHDAINALKRIPAHDALERRAYEIVRDWCDARIKEMDE